MSCPKSGGGVPASSSHVSCARASVARRLAALITALATRARIQREAERSPRIGSREVKPARAPRASAIPSLAQRIAVQSPKRLYAPLSTQDPQHSAPREPSPIDLPWLAVVATVTAVVLVSLASPSAAARDGAELTAAGASLGVAHPTGFALEVLLWRVAMLVPIGDVAFRANAITAVFGALCAAALSRLAMAWLHASEPSLSRIARPLSLLAPLALLCSQTTLRAFTAVEVYASSLFVALAAVVFVARSAAPSSLRALALCAGLSFVTHTSARVAVLACALSLLVVDRDARSTRSLRAAPQWIALALASAALVLYFPIAARRLPWVDWGGPVDARGVWTHLSAARIREAFSSQMGGHVTDALRESLGVLRSDLGAFALIASIAGALLALRDKTVLSLSVLLCALGDLAYSTLVNPMGTRDRQTLFLTEAALVLLAVRALVALTARASQPRARHAVGLTLSLLFAGSLSARFDASYAGAREGWTAVEVYGGPGAIGAAPARAVILCESDELCGGSLFARVCEGERPDVVVLPRQHLWDRTVWRRLRVALGHAPPERSQPRSFDEPLRVRRMQGVLSVFGPRVRWEQGDRVDERLARITLAPSESPVLAIPVLPNATATVTDETVDSVSRWLAPRESRGVLARRIAASVLFAAGMRATRDPTLDRAALCWQHAITHDPAHTGSLTNLAVARAQQGRLPEAVSLTERAIETDPSRAVAWQNLLRFCAEIRDTACAERARRGAREYGVNVDRAPSVHDGASR